MAEPEEKRPIIRRRVAPLRGQYVVLPDAVNETMRVIEATPEQMAIKTQVAGRQRQLNEQQARQQKAKRDEYRARRQEQDRANGIIFSPPMSDQQVDLAIAQEITAASQPQFKQGYSESERQARRNAGLLYTQEDIEQAKRLAEAHNASFFGSMVAPTISPEMAEKNPEYVSQVVRGDAMVLPNAFISGLSLGAPSASAALGNGVRQGWQTAGNIGARVANAATQGAKAITPVVTNPRWATTAAAVTVPAVVDAAVVAGDGGGSSSSYTPLILGTAATALGGYGAYKGYNVVKRAGWNLKALSPTKEGAAIRAASKAPQATSTALVPYAGTYQRPGFFESWWETPKKSAAAAGLPVPTRGQIWGARGRNYLRATGYGMGAGTLLDLGMSGASGEPFQWKAGRLPIALPEYVLKGGYNALKGWYYPNAETNNTQATETTITNSTDSVPERVEIVIPDSPYGAGVNIDSLESVAYGIPYTRKQ